MTDKIVWGSPPPVRRVTAAVKRWKPVLEQFVSHPGESGRVGGDLTDEQAHSLAVTIRRVAAEMDVGNFNVKARSLPGGKGGVWVTFSAAEAPVEVLADLPVFPDPFANDDETEIPDEAIASVDDYTGMPGYETAPAGPPRNPMPWDGMPT